MAYQKQTWRDYDDTKTELQNVNNGAVVTPERLNHIENGIANSADKAEVTAQLQHNEQVVAGIDRTFGDQTFATLTALQAQYPTGDTKRYIVAADGKWYWWNGVAWTPGQIAQAVGIADKSVKAISMYSSEVLDRVNLIEFVELARTDRYYLEPSNLITKPSVISIEFKASDVRTGKIVMLKKITNILFEIVDTFTYTSKVGINYVETPFVANGTGDEYVTLINFSIYYKSYADVKGHYTTLNIENIMGNDIGDLIPTIDQTTTGKIKMGYNIILSDFSASNKLAKLENKINDLDTSEVQSNSLNDAYVAWKKGEKFPIAFFGDSTIDGTNTTGHVANVIGTDNVSPNAFSMVLQDKLREEFGNNNLRIYNAGFAGMTANWGVQNLNNVFGEGKPYSDTKAVGIGFGINDRLEYADEKSYRNGFRNHIITMIKWFKSRGIQPFLLTTQVAISPGVSTDYTNQYPMRDAKSINTIANEVKRELAKEYRLELIDLNHFTERFLKYSRHSANTIISDKLHFGDVGHEYEAGLMFSKINPTVTFLNKKCQIDLTSQNLVVGVPEDKITMVASPSDGFKVIADYTKLDSSDILIFKSHVFNDSDGLLTVKAFKTNPESATYVKLNGTAVSLTAIENVIGQIDLGLHTLEVFTGANAAVDFKGFKIE